MRVAIVGAGVSGLGAAIDAGPRRPRRRRPRARRHAAARARRTKPSSGTAGARRRSVTRMRSSRADATCCATGSRRCATRSSPPARPRSAGRTWCRTRSPTARPQPGDEDLVMLACRRTTFEWVLRTQALDTDRVEIRDGTIVTGLRATNGSVRAARHRRCRRMRRRHRRRPRRRRDRTSVASDRPSRPASASRSPRRSRARGSSTSRGSTGCARGPSRRSQSPFNGADVGYLKFAIFRGDNRTFSITLAYDIEDADMVQPAREAACSTRRSRRCRSSRRGSTRTSPNRSAPSTTWAG